MYAYLIASTGWTFDEIDKLDMPKVEALMKYFNANPPVHLMVKSYLGIKTEETKKPVDNTEFFQLFTGGVLHG